MNRLEKLRADVVGAFPDTFPDVFQLRVEGVLDAFIAEMEVVEVAHYKEGCRNYLALVDDPRFGEFSSSAPYPILVPRAKPELPLLVAAEAVLERLSQPSPNSVVITSDFLEAIDALAAAAKRARQ